MHPYLPCPGNFNQPLTTVVKHTNPVFSTILLLVTYIMLSWFLYQTTAPWLVWVLALVFAIVQASLLTTLSEGLRRFISNWLKSDIGYFSIIALGAFSITIILVWFHVFEYFLMVVGAELLARLDLQNAGLNRWQSLGVLTITSIVGLSAGLIVSYLVGRQVLPG